MVECIARPRPIYIVGDSLACVFADRVYQAPGDATRYLARTKYLQGLTAAAFATEDGALHPDVLGALTSESIAVLDDDGEMRALHCAESRAWRYAAVTMGRPRRAPALVVMCGSLDFAQELYALGADADFALPPEIADRSEPATTPLRAVSTAHVAAIVERRVAPLERGVRTLRAMGFEHVFVHSIAPTNPDDDAFFDAYGFAGPARLRYKLSAFFNDRIARAAERAGASYLDLWADTMDRATIRPEFVLDVCHFNHRAAALTMERLFERWR